MDISRNHLYPATDEQLLAMHLKGDRQAFEILIERYKQDVFHFLCRFLGNSSAADDVFQDTFIQVFQSAGQFTPGRTLRPWLFMIAANKARDFLRSKSRKQLASLQAVVDPRGNDSPPLMDLIQSEITTPLDQVEKLEMQQRIRNALWQLPDAHREIITMAFFAQMPYKQISETLHVPLGTVKSRLHSAVSAFANIWKTANLTAD